MRIMYFLGPGHTGSTVIDSLCGSHPKVSGTGESHRLVLESESMRCGCGETLADCSRWAGVIKSLPGPSQSEFPMTVVRNRRSVDALADFVVGGVGAERRIGSDYRRRLSEAVLNSVDVYRRLSTLESTDVVIDSTKNAGRLLGYMRVHGLETTVVRLRRDGRAIVASHKRRQPSISTLYATLAWLKVELTCWWILRISECDAYSVRYEDFCSDPEAVVRGIWRAARLEDFDASFSEIVAAQERHLIPGNPVISSPISQVARDDRWREELSALDRVVFTLLGGPINRKNGYPLR